MDVSHRSIPISLLDAQLAASTQGRLAAPCKLDSKNAARLGTQLAICALFRGSLQGSVVTLRAMAVKFGESTGMSLYYGAISGRLRFIGSDCFRDTFDRVAGPAGHNSKFIRVAERNQSAPTTVKIQHGRARARPVFRKKCGRRSNAKERLSYD